MYFAGLPSDSPRWIFSFISKIIYISLVSVQSGHMRSQCSHPVYLLILQPYFTYKMEEGSSVNRASQLSSHARYRLEQLFTPCSQATQIFPRQTYALEILEQVTGSSGWIRTKDRVSKPWWMSAHNLYWTVPVIKNSLALFLSSLLFLFILKIRMPEVTFPKTSWYTYLKCALLI